MFILSLLSTVNATHVSPLLLGRAPQNRGSLVRQRRLDVPGARAAPLLGRRRSPGGSTGGVAATGVLHADAPGGGVLSQRRPPPAYGKLASRKCLADPACWKPEELPSSQFTRHFLVSRRVIHRRRIGGSRLSGGPRARTGRRTPYVPGRVALPAPRCRSGPRCGRPMPWFWWAENRAAPASPTRPPLAATACDSHHTGCARHKKT